MWHWLKDPDNRSILAWLGSGLVVVAGGLWAVLLYLYPAESGSSSPSVQVEQGVGAGGDISVGGDLNVSGSGRSDKPAE
jgi:hypothetical protein